MTPFQEDTKRFAEQVALLAKEVQKSTKKYGEELPLKEACIVAAILLNRRITQMDD